jgi:integrase
MIRISRKTNQRTRQAASVRKGRHRKQIDSLTVEEAVRRYIAVRDEPNGGAASVTTITAYTRYADNHLDDLGPRQARYVTEEDLRLYRDRLSQKTTPKIVDGATVFQRLSPKYVKNICSLVTSAINEAIPDARLVLKYKKTRGKSRPIPTEGDVVRILQAAEGTELYKAILLALCMGDRRSQVCGVEYRDIDRKACTVSIERAMVKDIQNQLQEKAPKTDASVRVVEVAPEMIDLLSQGEGAPREKVVKMKPSAVTKSFALLIRKLGMPKYTFHGLRHFNASAMLALGVPDLYAQERGGWATDHVLKTVYQHTLDKKKAEVDYICNSYFTGLINRAKERLS